MTKKKSESLEWIKALAIAIILVVIARSFLITPIVVEGASMNTTLQDKDRMIVTKIGDPKRFDIVVFHAKEQQDYIKRVIGLPGDTIEFKNDTLYVNGKAYDEPYLDDQKMARAGDLTEPFKLEDTAVGQKTVPEGTVFVMGDNRQNSEDSRMIGAIPMDQIVGKTNLIYYPFKDFKIIHN
ncbi:signal peptidase I [Rossellomorea marisflavi]|uniref:signal peptidase I n=1 Tax=Rossellomorea marisflavi TaxID=189381 RepID=UPI002079B554|nr:signal peptidase I [Rossellomorea marisflavi]USK92139.1 signal peptidase I [Rossellomorea marisflavi]